MCSSMDSNQIVNAEDALDNFNKLDGIGPILIDPENFQNDSMIVKPTFKFI